ncbi:MAG: low molecular weight phosphotyrosine protein phosphatase [Lachnospiraceae bacterium]|nr:low molecular weight phosphotyrosine protein phosphatase [Lachnospiraceae bacterium]
MIKILFICHGNICRSPMSEFVLKDMVEKRGIKDQFYIASAATSREEIWGDVGNPVYPPAKAELKKHGIGATPYTDFSGKRAVQVTKADYDKYDYILCADSANIRNTLRIVGADPEGKIKLLLEYAGRPGESIADPWYTGNFEITYKDIEEGLEGFLKYLGK